MTEKNNALLRAAVAGLVGATIVSAPALAAGKKSKKQTAEVKPCYGVNKCSTFGKCSGPGHECAGKNGCKGQGWLPMPPESCLAIEGGSLTPIEPKKDGAAAPAAPAGK